MNQTSFWNFKDKKVYTSTGQKLADFLFGVFVPMIFWFSINPTGADAFLFHFLFFMFEIIAAIFLFKRRPRIFYGMIFVTVIFPAVLLLPFILMYGGFSRF